jgi:hypothetical protein
MKFTESKGNVIIEVALAVSVMAGLLYPAIVSLGSVTAAQRQADEVSFALARLWTLTPSAQRSASMGQAIHEAKTASQRPLFVQWSCSPQCSSQNATVTVKVSVDPLVSGVKPRQASVSLARDRYGL